ncbi:MAG: lipopolysaccharide biosynthesis protein [Prevotella sp.]|nr:lipopolysaccharide biosynthesis protein [Prevotella sp.]
MDTLKEKTAKGLFWGAVNNGTMQILNILIGIVLGRLLSPGEYGLVGMLTIFTMIAGNLQSCGFTQALVNIKAPTARDYNSVFWFNIMMSVTLYVILFLCAPLIAMYYRRPELVALSRLVFLAFLISSFGIAHNAYMFKNMMNREQAIVGFFSLVISGATGIALAYSGFSYWSLAWQQIIFITCVNIGRYYYVPWRPSTNIDFSPVRKMFAFSSKMLVTSIINTVNVHILTVIFGRLFSAAAVGNFTQANKWNVTAHTFVSGTITQVAQPVLASISEDERERRVFHKMMRFTAFLSFPCMLGLSLIAHDFILVLLGERWAQCVPLMQVLCIGGAFMPLYALYQNLAISSGRSDIYMWCSIAQIVLQIAVILCFHGQGIMGMVRAYTLFNIAWLAAWHIFTSRLIRLRAADVVLDVAPFAAVALLTMAVAYFCPQQIGDMRLRLVARIAVAVVVYVGVMKLLRVRILDECINFIIRKK